MALWINFSFIYVLHVGKARQPNLVSGELTQMGNSPSTRHIFDFFKTPKQTPLLTPRTPPTPPPPPTKLQSHPVFLQVTQFSFWRVNSRGKFALDSADIFLLDLAGSDLLLHFSRFLGITPEQQKSWGQTVQSIKKCKVKIRSLLWLFLSNHNMN